MRYLILGPLAVLDGDRPVELGSRQQQALLAVLILRANELVTTDELIEALWGDRAPATAAKIVQNHVSKLRRALSGAPGSSSGEVLVTRGGGYLLRADPREIDAREFERLVAEAGNALDADEADRAAELAAEALVLWRGSPLADFRYESFAQAEIARLEEQHLLANEHRIAAALALGKHDSVQGELEQLVTEHPLRERIWELRMLALYRSGRQAEALDCYQRLRANLAEVGLEPGRAARELQEAILAQDPELGGSHRGFPLGARQRKRGWTLILAGGAILLAAGVAMLIVVLDDGDDAPGDRVRALSGAFCSPVSYALGANPELLIVSDQPLEGPEAGVGNQVAAAIEFTLRENDFRAGPHAVAYQACNEAVRGDVTEEQCSENARAYAENPSVIGVIGPLLSFCATEMIPIANRAPMGPLAIVSPSNTLVGLTRAGIGTSADEPEVYYPSGVRNYARVVPADDYQMAANAVLAQRMGLTRMFVLRAGNLPQNRALATGFEAAARKLGIKLAGSAPWRAPADYDDLGNRVRRSGADGVVLAGPGSEDGAELVRDLRAALGSTFPIMAPEGFAIPGLVDEIGRASEGMTVSNLGISPDAAEGSGRRFVARLGAALGEDPSQFAAYASISAQVMLDSIARSDGSRASVVQELFDTRIRHGLLGDFAITPTGDTTATDVTIHRVRNGQLEVGQVIRPSSHLLVRD